MADSSRSPRLRLFLGIAVNLEEQQQLLQSRLRALSTESFQQLRLSPPENLHITLKFLGPVDGARVEQLDILCRQLAMRHGPFTVVCRGVGAFPNALWLGVEAQPRLSALAADLDMACASIGFLQERKAYLPHVTVARFRAGARIRLRDFIAQNRDTRWQHLETTEFALYRSDTLPKGARYTIIRRYSLEGLKEGSGAR